MTKRIFVGNLSFQTTESDLTALFAQVAEVESVKIITDRATGRSKGFAFVEMGSENADKAMAHFNGTELNGRSLNVNEARPREERSSGGFGRNRNDRDRNGSGSGHSRDRESRKGDNKEWWA